MKFGHITHNEGIVLAVEGAIHSGICCVVALELEHKFKLQLALYLTAYWDFSSKLKHAPNCIFYHKTMYLHDFDGINCIVYFTTEVYA